MNRNIIASLLALALTTSYVQAQEDAPETLPPTENAQAAESLKPLSRDPQLVTGVLENGLSYMIRPTKEPAGRASARLFVNTGSLDECPENSGISHFIEHMVFNGSRHFKRGELIPAMERLGLGFGGDANAYTSFLRTVYMIDMPNLDPETVDFALMIMRDYADGATLEDDAIDHERGIVISELKSRDSESMRAQIAQIKLLTPGTRLADYMPIGLEEVLRNAPYSVVRDYYRDHYVPSNMTFILTGDIDPKEAEGWIRKHFSDMEAREPQPRKPYEPLTDLGPAELVQPNSEQGNLHLMISVISPFQVEPDTIEQRIKDMPLNVAFAMLTRRLERIARKADSPFIRAAVGKEDMIQASNVFSIDAQAKPELWKDALTRIELELRSAIEHGFSETELQEILQDSESTLRQMCATWETVPAAKMANDLVSSIADGIVQTPPEEDLRAFLAGVQEILKDPDCCRRALAKEYDADRVKLIATGKVPEELTNEGLRAAYNEAHAMPAPEPAKQDALQFAYDHEGDAGTIVSEEKLEDIGVTVLRLSNGVRVNLKPTDFSKGSISLTATVDGGNFNMPTTPGLPSMISAMMSSGGLEAHTQDDLQRLLSGKQAGVAFDIWDDRFAFNGSTNSKDFAFQCKLMVAHILHPGYRKDGEDQLHRNLPAFYQRLRTTPDGAFSMMSAPVLFNKDPRFCIPHAEEMMAMDTEQARSAIEPFLKDGAMEVTIVGDFKVEEIKDAILESFGAMPQRKAEFTPIPAEKRNVRMDPWGKRVFLRYPTQLDKTIVTQVRAAGNGMDRKRNRRMLVLSAIAREKLFDGLRAAMGQAYSPIVRYTANEEYENAAYISTISHGVKGNRELVDSAMFSICTGLGEGAFTDEEFDCAIRPILSSTQKMLRSNSFWQGSLASIQSKPERLELLRGMMDDLKSITADEIRALAKEVFVTDKVVHFFTVPNEEGDTMETEIKEEPESEPETEAVEEDAEERPREEASPAGPAAPAVSYAVLISKETAAKPEWRQVAEALVKKYEPEGWSVVIEEVADFNKETVADALRRHGVRYAAMVMQPEEVNRPVVSALHRAARMVDDDPWGDCLWGIVTGYSAQDALRIAETKDPLVIKRLLATTNVGAGHFEYSYCLTDWTGSPVLEQSGYTEPKTIQFPEDSMLGKMRNHTGSQGLIAERLENAKAQMMVTSSHATQYNLEMPFSLGLIFPYANRFYCLPRNAMRPFVQILQAVREGKTDLKQFSEIKFCNEIKPDGTPRVWLAAGNCLIGDAAGDKNSMVVTALSAYTCKQFVGYTVPSWFGEGGWGTLACFFDNTDGTSLAEAFFLNNQFMLHKSMELDPKILTVDFDGDTINRDLYGKVAKSGIQLKNGQDAQKVIGLIHDRDVVAFYGDPAWSASLDCSHAKCPFRIEWKDAKTFTITANMDRKGRCAVWFPTSETGRNATGCDAEDAVFTNDFILFPELDMKKDESRTVTIR